MLLFWGINERIKHALFPECLYFSTPPKQGRVPLAKDPKSITATAVSLQRSNSY